VTQINSGNGIFGGTITSTGTISVIANSGIVSNTTGLWAQVSNGLTLTASGINVVGGTGVISNSTGVHIGQAVGTTASVTFANVVTTDLSVSGNLIVSGTTTTVDTVTMAVKDNMIVLADQQANTTTFTDFVDAGWYILTGNTSQNNYSGMARIAASSTNTNPYFKLFSTTTSPNSSVINTGATIGTLQAYLAPFGVGGAFIVNTIAMAFTANNTVSLAIAANSLSLTTALPATSGGTGTGTYTSGDMLIANTGNALSKLNIGSDGHVLQVSGSTVVWGIIDGGTF
jgi:hypothetical protein